MKKMIGLMVSGLAISGLLTAQTLNVQVGNVLYQFPAAQTAQMPYENSRRHKLLRCRTRTVRP